MTDRERGEERPKAAPPEISFEQATFEQLVAYTEAAQAYAEGRHPDDYYDEDYEDEGDYDEDEDEAVDAEDGDDAQPDADAAPVEVVEREYVLPRRRREETLVNATRLEAEDIRRLVSLLIGQQKGVRLYRIFIALFGLAFFTYGVISVILVLTGQSASYLLSGIFVGLLGLGSIWLAVWGIIRLTSRRMLRQPETFANSRHYRFTQDGVSVWSEGRSGIDMPWSETTRWLSDERSIYISAHGSWMIIHRDSFEHGSAEELIAIIEDKVERGRLRFWGGFA